MANKYVDKQTVSVVGKTYLVSDIHKLAEGKRPIRVPYSHFKEDMLDATWFEDGTAPNMEEIDFHIERIMDAELKYPVIYLRDRGLLDGWHRIFKSKIQGKDYINVIFLDEEELQNIESV